MGGCVCVCVKGGGCVCVCVWVCGCVGVWVVVCVGVGMRGVCARGWCGVGGVGEDVCCRCGCRWCR